MRAKKTGLQSGDVRERMKPQMGATATKMRPQTGARLIGDRIANEPFEKRASQRGSREKAALRACGCVSRICCGCACGICARVRVPTMSVLKGGVEPPRPFGHTDLNRARLPIPPLELGRLCGDLQHIGRRRVFQVRRR